MPVAPLSSVARFRIACRSFNAHRLLWPRLRRIGAFNLYKYASHKLLRWFSVLWLALASLSALGFAASIGIFWPILAVGVIGGVDAWIAFLAQDSPIFIIASHCNRLCSDRLWDMAIAAWRSVPDLGPCCQASRQRYVYTGDAATLRRPRCGTGGRPCQSVRPDTT